MALWIAVSSYRDTLERLARSESVPQSHLAALIAVPEREVREYAAGLAREIAVQHFGHKVYLRGLLEVSNVCAAGCYYCGLRAENRSLSRYTLTEEEILESCEEGYALGLRSFVLQGGQRADYREPIERVAREFKRRMPDAALTLSLGEQSGECYEEWRRAGADRYLLRHESANEWHYGRLHPESMSYQNRLGCLKRLSELGYQCGAGFMVGTPEQTALHLAEEVEFLAQLRPQMVGIGPFIPHSATPFGQMPQGSVEQTLLMISLVRLVLHKALMPSTTALATASDDGTQQGVLAGANVVMPNITPKRYRAGYEIYNGKKSYGTEAVEGLERLADLLGRVGYEASLDRGDHPDFADI